ncbi:MAG: hypothetical protein ABGZ53_22675 [Fuerstiella sp.]
MSAKISRSARDELLNAIRLRYVKASRDEKGRILDEAVALLSCHRKHAIRLLQKSCSSPAISDGVLYVRTASALYAFTTP